jgi:hypothetical protein
MPTDDSTTERQPVALTVTMHCETVSWVAVHDISTGDDVKVVSLVLGDDRSGVRLLGNVDDVYEVVERARRLLNELA